MYHSFLWILNKHLWFLRTHTLQYTVLMYKKCVRYSILSVSFFCYDNQMLKFDFLLCKYWSGEPPAQNRPLGGKIYKVYSWGQNGGDEGKCQRGLNTKKPTIVFFLGPTKSLLSYDSASDTMLVKGREMTDRTQTLPWWLGGEKGKDDRKQNTLTFLGNVIEWAKREKQNIEESYTLVVVEIGSIFQSHYTNVPGNK